MAPLAGRKRYLHLRCRTPQRREKTRYCALRPPGDIVGAMPRATRLKLSHSEIGRRSSCCAADHFGQMRDIREAAVSGDFDGSKRRPLE